MTDQPRDLHAAMLRLADEWGITGNDDDFSADFAEALGENGAWRFARDFTALLAEHRDERPAPEPPSGHDFLPVRGHPDDDECTHRGDGTDATYCGRTRAEHEAERPAPDPLDTAAYWQDRFLRMRALYRIRFTEGLSSEDWHRKHCGLMAGADVTADELADVLVMTPLSDFAGTDMAPINATAAAILARFHVTRRDTGGQG